MTWGILGPMTQALTLRGELLELLTRICQTPAPTFAEEARGALLASLWREAGLTPHTDEVGNVLAELPGGAGPRVLVAAHLDTVFSAGTDVRIRRQEGRWLAPGIGDNSASLAILAYYARHAEAARPRLTLAATVGEEGLGDLCGMRALMDVRASSFDLVVALDGHLGTVVDRSVGSKRFEVTFGAAGGHSWGDYPSPSAVHALGDALHALTRVSVPREPRSSLNVGQVWGGASVNAIAQDARFNLDLRSLDATVLAGLEQEALRRVRRVARSHGVQVGVAQVGFRPAASSDNEKLVQAARKALESLGLPCRTAASSTDANAAMAAGLSAVAFGVYRGGDAHRQSEWLEPDSLPLGYQAFARFMGNLAEPET